MKTPQVLAVAKWPSNMTRERAGEIALVIMWRIFGKRGFDFRAGPKNDWCEAKVRRGISEDNPSSLKHFVNYVILDAIKNPHAAMPYMGSFGPLSNGEACSIALELLALEDSFQPFNFKDTLEKFKTTSDFTIEEFRSLVIHHLIPQFAYRFVGVGVYLTPC